MSGPEGTPEARAAWWGHRARAALSYDARAQADPESYDLIPHDVLREALVAVLRIEPGELVDRIVPNDQAPTAFLRGAWAVVHTLRSAAGRILTGDDDAGPDGPPPDGSAVVDGDGAAVRSGPPYGPPVSRVRGGDGAKLPTVITGSGPLFIVLDGAGTVLAHDEGWNQAHDIAHDRAERPGVDLPVTILSTASLTQWTINADGCHRPRQPGGGLGGYVCPYGPVRPPRPGSRARRPRTRVFGFVTVPFLAIAKREAPTDPAGRIGRELRGFLATCRASLDEIENKTVDLAFLATAPRGADTAALRVRIDRIMTRLSLIVVDLESIAHDE
jgi:hypothetical protein